MTPVVELHGVSVTYPDADRPALREVDLTVDEGEWLLVGGRTGAGKSTLLGLMSGLVPHFSGGTLSGRVTVGGRDTAVHPPRELADLVGFVGQDPAAGFVTDSVVDELAFVMEELGVAPAAMRRRIEETLDLLGIAELRDRPLSSLSGGQQQRVAIASVLTAAPRLLILDEPTSALDPAGAEDVLAAIARLVHDLGVSVVMSEHRLERVVHLADTMCVVGPDGRTEVGDVASMMVRAPVAPAVVELGRLAGWSPLPLSVRDARRRATELRERLGPPPPATMSRGGGPVIAAAEAVVARHDRTIALDRLSLELRAGQVTAIMGRNGAGKTTALRCLVGLHTPASGTVRVGGVDPTSLSGRELVTEVGMVPQDASILLYAETVAEECATADHDGHLVGGATASMLGRLDPDGSIEHSAHPRSLSAGQQLTVALAIILAHRPELLLLDEPTRGLDYGAKDTLAAVLAGLADQGVAVVIATHDVELVAAVADRVVVLADGAVIADGPAREVVGHSPVFAPQTAKILAPDDWLTVGEVRTALEHR